MAFSSIYFLLSISSSLSLYLCLQSQFTVDLLFDYTFQINKFIDIFTSLIHLAFVISIFTLSLSSQHIHEHIRALYYIYHIKCCYELILRKIKFNNYHSLNINHKNCWKLDFEFQYFLNAPIRINLRYLRYSKLRSFSYHRSVLFTI